MAFGFRFPDDTKRTVIIGRTGSGKSQAGAWLLSHLSINRIPWIVFDYKNEELLNAIPFVQHLALGAALPDKPGVYLVKPRVETDDDAVENLMLQIWERENCGVFIDELYMIGNTTSLRLLLTQGRSKHIPFIGLTQRPKWVSKFVFSEANFMQIFWLNDSDDRKAIERYLPEDRGGESVYRRLPDYYSLWYDIDRDRLLTLEPVPDSRAILDGFARRLAPKQENVESANENRTPLFRFL